MSISLSEKLSAGAVPSSRTPDGVFTSEISTPKRALDPILCAICFFFMALIALAAYVIFTFPQP